MTDHNVKVLKDKNFQEYMIAVNTQEWDRLLSQMPAESHVPRPAPRREIDDFCVLETPLALSTL